MTTSPWADPDPVGPDLADAFPAEDPGDDPGDDDDDLPALADTVAGGGLWRVSVAAGVGGQRLDRLLAALAADQAQARAAGLSRTRLRALIEQGCVREGARILSDPALRVKDGQTFDVFIPDPVPASPLAQEIPLHVVYEDEWLLVVDKPAGMVVHPAPGNPDMTLVNALLAHCGDSLSGVGGVCRPGIVHRLDKDTSGLMVVAKTNEAHGGLSRQFGDRTICRTYSAVTWGIPLPVTGEINQAIGRSPRDRKKMAVVERGGKPALTRYRTLRRFGRVAAQVECRLATGRTHQIRVHLAFLGHPLVGDPLYGAARPLSRLGAEAGPVAREAVTGFQRQALHARVLELIHPGTGEAMRFETPLPADLAQLIEALATLGSG